MKRADKWSVTQSELTEITGLSRKTIRVLERDGLPCVGLRNKKRYRLPEVWTFCRERWELESGGVSPALEEWRRHRAALAKIELERAEEKVADVDEVLGIWQEMIIGMRTRLMALPLKLAAQCVGLDANGIRSLATQCVRHALQAMSQDWVGRFRREAVANGEVDEFDREARRLGFEVCDEEQDQVTA